MKARHLLIVAAIFAAMVAAWAIAHETTPHEQTEAQAQFLQPFGA